MYRALYQILRSYWRDYGGWSEVAKSPFFHFSVVVAALNNWDIVEIDWATLCTGSLPTILGFSLAAYTITFTLMGSALHRALSNSIDRNSGLPLIRIVNATFFHVIMFQAVALVFAITTKGTFFWRVLGGSPSFENVQSVMLYIVINGGEFVGCLLSIYAIFLLFSVAIAMFRLGRLTGKAASPTAANSNDKTPGVLAGPRTSIATTWRFGVVKFVAKVLRIYD